MPSEAVTAKFLGEIYNAYQATMHATRAAVFYLPNLDRVELRQIKTKIFNDDDNLPGDGSHHAQLRIAFENMGAKGMLPDNAFGDPKELRPSLNRAMAAYVKQTYKNYKKTLGPWCYLEGVSVNFMAAFMDALAKHHPDIVKEPYFAECIAGKVEEIHAALSLETTQKIMDARPHLVVPALKGAKAMAENLDSAWGQHHEIVMRRMEKYSRQHGSASKHLEHAGVLPLRTVSRLLALHA
jgi:hypothetical protein